MTRPTLLALVVGWLNTITPTTVSIIRLESGYFSVSDASGDNLSFLPADDDDHFAAYVVLDQVQDFMQMGTHDQFPDPLRSSVPWIVDTASSITFGYAYAATPRHRHPPDQPREWCSFQQVALSEIEQEPSTGT